MAGHRKKSIDKNVYELAKERIRHAYNLFDDIWVSFSGGKDSTAVLNTTLEIAKEKGRLPLNVFFFDEEAIPYQVEHYVRRVIKTQPVNLKWYCLPLKQRNGCSVKHKYWYCWDKSVEDKWCRPLPKEAITSVDWYDYTDIENRKSIPELMGGMFPVKKYGNVGVLMGIRAQESMTRMRAVLNREKENYIIKHTSSYAGSKVVNDGNLFKVYPIYDWNTEDVWTAPKLFGWDYCEYYDILEMLGISHSSQRLGPPYGEEPMRSLDTFQETFPELWDKMINRVPGASCASRYSRTDLYGFGGSGKPDGIPWNDYIKHLLTKHPEKDRQDIASRIKSFIEQHNSKTNNAIILGNARHPDSGVSWSGLAQIAIRGDMKNRRNPSIKVQAPGSKENLAMIKKYNKELKEYLNAK